MAFSNSVRRMGEAVVATAATAALFYFGNGLEPRWWLMWFAPLPLLIFALRNSWWSSTLAAVAAITVGYLNMWSYFTKTLGMPTTMWVNISVTASVFFALGVLLFRALALRGAVWNALIALPAMWVTTEYVRNLMTPHGSAGSLAYSQLGFLPFLQLASVTGPWGMTFVLLLFASSLAIVWHLWSKGSIARRSAQWVAATGIGVAAAVIALGTIRLALPQGATTRVGLVASDLKKNEGVVDPGAETERLFGDYERSAESLTVQGAQAVVIPEMLGVTLTGKSAATDAIMQSLAERSRATVVAGVIDANGSVRHNEARVYAPAVPIAGYDKQHLLPPFESKTTPGTQLLTLPREKQLWGVAICKDMDFADPARSYAREGAGLMLVPAWDFVVDRSWHGHIAVMRGVEGGFSIARAAKGGYLTVSDWRGRILGEVRSNAAPFATLLVDVPAAHHATLYQVMGDWFAWFSIALLAFVIVRAVLPRSRA